MDGWPEVRYARVGEADVAYTVLGDAAVDLVFFFGLGSHVDLVADDPSAVRLLRALATFSRVINFNRRGTGLSDSIGRIGVPTWEDWTDDLGGVLDAAGSSSAAVFASLDAGPVAIQFAAMRPDRVRALVLANTSARFRSDDDYPIGLPQEAVDDVVDLIGSMWGTEAFMLAVNPDMQDDPEGVRATARQMRACATPRTAAAQYRYILETVDTRRALPLVQAPTLVLHNRDNPIVPRSHGQYLAAEMPNARYLEIPGIGLAFDDDVLELIVDEVSQLVTGERPPPVPGERVLATVMFSDIVGSTEQLARVGDRRWRLLLDRHDRLVRKQLAHFGGREIKTTGDGFLAAFDGPAKAMRCGTAITAEARALGLQARVGLHTGECEVRGSDLTGITVHVASRIADRGAGSEVIVSALTAELAAGSGIACAPRGTHELRGVAGQWQLLAVTDVDG